MFRLIFLLPFLVKRDVINSNKNGIYELPHELPNKVRLKIIVKKAFSGKCQNSNLKSQDCMKLWPSTYFKK